MNIDNFKASLNWIYKLLKRKNITHKLINGESRSVDESVVEEWAKAIPAILCEYSKDEIYNVDEAALFWKKSNGRTFSPIGVEPKGCKQRKERLTVLLGTSASGEKLPVLVIGKQLNPRPFKGTNAKEIVDYRAHKNGWMTTEIFTDWLKSFDETLEKKKKKVLLLIDHFSGHNVSNTKNVKLLYLPANTTSVTQPMDAGIIKNFKDHYRKLLNGKIVEKIDEKLKSDEILKQVNIFEAIVFISLAWSAVERQTIINCWKKVGFDKP